MPWADYPDLVAKQNAPSLVIAGKQDKGTISDAEPPRRAGVRSVPQRSALGKTEAGAGSPLVRVPVLQRAAGNGSPLSCLFSGAEMGAPGMRVVQNS
jgi:hypothetical protein